MIRWQRGTLGIDAAVVLVVVVVAAALLVLVRVAGAGDRSAGRAGAAAPARDLATGQFVRADITAEGDLEVTHWISTRTPVSELRVHADRYAAEPGATAVEDVEVTTGGATVATLPSVGAAAQEVTLDAAVQQLTVTYRIESAVDGDDATVDGRALAVIPALSIDYPGETGPVRRRVAAAGDILNVACVRTDGLVPRPCGAAAGDDWQVDLDGADRDNGLVVQVQLRQA